MNKLAQMTELYNLGVSGAMDRLVKMAEDGDSGLSMDAVEKVAEARAQDTISNVAYQTKIATMVGTLGSTINFLRETGHTKAAEAVEAAAEEELAAADVPPEALEEGEIGEEEAVAAAMQGAAQVIADATGSTPDDPDVQEAAAEVVQEIAEEEM